MNISEKKIDYRYLDLDSNEYVTEQELLERLKYSKNGLLRCIPNYKHDQILIAGKSKYFTEMDALVACMKLKKENK